MASVVELNPAEYLGLQLLIGSSAVHIVLTIRLLIYYCYSDALYALSSEYSSHFSH